MVVRPGGQQVAERVRGRGDVAMTTSEIMALTRSRDMAYGTLVDSNVLLDIMTEDPVWHEWSAIVLADVAESGPLYINPVIFAEVSVRFTTIEASRMRFRLSTIDANLCRGPWRFSPGRPS